MLVFADNFYVFADCYAKLQHRCSALATVADECGIPFSNSSLDMVVNDTPPSHMVLSDGRTPVRKSQIKTLGVRVDGRGSTRATKATAMAV